MGEGSRDEVFQTFYQMIPPLSTSAKYTLFQCFLLSGTEVSLRTGLLA